MSDKFKNVPVDADTNILFSAEANLGEYDVLYQKWSWDGIIAESVIFVSEDVADISDAEIEAEVRTSPLVEEESQMTIKRAESGFTFANFNFLGTE